MNSENNMQVRGHNAHSGHYNNYPRPLPLFLDLVREAAIDDPHLAAQAMLGLKRYQQAPRIDAARPQHIAAEVGRVRLIDYGGDGPPVIFIPSLINPHIVLDLTSENSLIRYIRASGFRPFLVDWGQPRREHHTENLNDHIVHYLRPLIEGVDKQYGTPHLVGYCLGGTIALAAAHIAPAASLSLIAAPWHFDHYGEDKTMLSGLWTDNKEACAALGLVPVEVLQIAFWRMDPARTVKKYARLANTGEATLAQFVALEDWANEGAPLTYAAGRALFEQMFAANISGTGDWVVDGYRITPDTLPCPARQFVSTTDRIVPLASCPQAIESIPSTAGHVGMVVGSSAHTTLWEPMAKWLSQVQQG